jgi:hypothetical protein
MPAAFTAPDSAREMLAQVTRDHPDSLPHILEWLADIEEAKAYLAGHPPTPLPPLSELDYLHLSAVRTWMALSQRRPAPVLDTDDLHQVIYTQFSDRDGENAARNLVKLAASGAESENACGGTVRPRLARHDPVKQEPGTSHEDKTGTVPRQRGTVA